MAQILIIDDAIVIRDLLEEYLSDLGHKVDTAVDGLDGIGKALAGDYDVIFCDIHMPRRNGYEVFMEVSVRKPRTTFIMTDSLPDHLAEQAQEAGAYTCLAKPFDLEEIEAALANIMVKSSV